MLARKGDLDGPERVKVFIGRLKVALGALRRLAGWWIPASSRSAILKL